MIIVPGLGRSRVRRPMTTFPSFLHAAFDEADLSRHSGSISVVDRHDNIVWVNDAWHRFAAENGVSAGDLARWRSYLGAIVEPLRSHYAAAFSSALASGKIFEQDYECSSPERRRVFHLRALPFEGEGLVLEHTLLVETSWSEEPHAPLEHRYLGDGSTIMQCSNCRRVRDPLGPEETFHWVPAWIRAPHPRTSHVICTLCAGFFWRR